ncbi:helix-turn-helix domain-containing protein [Cohnella sp.]|uniref:helix-turn-helix domain-containing protein n=1 Tax=Cohnella sp. TaxID=1883426 RepID=UPI003703A9D9
MDTQNLKSIMAANIKRLLSRSGKSQTDLANDLNIPETTVSNWMNANTYPRIDKIQAMADYFGVRRSELTEQVKEFPDSDDLLFKFNALDSRGKHTVRTVLDVEYDRCNKPYLEVVAAHNEDYSEEQQRLIKEDLDELEELHNRRTRPR